MAIQDFGVQFAIHILKTVQITGDPKDTLDYHDVIYLPETPLDIDTALAIFNASTKTALGKTKAEITTLITTRINNFKQSVLAARQA